MRYRDYLDYRKVKLRKYLKPTLSFKLENSQNMIDLFNKYYYCIKAECEESDNQKSSDEKWLIENLKDI